MRRLLIAIVFMGVCLPSALMAGGCGEKQGGAKTPEQTKAFGVANQPMPPEAREEIMKASKGGPPPGAANPPKP